MRVSRDVAQQFTALPDFPVSIPISVDGFRPARSSALESDRRYGMVGAI